jgi:hypothetical protein
MPTLTQKIQIMSNKRMFQILDEMNLHDVDNDTKLVKLSNTFISADKVKQGAKISMGADEESLFDLASEKYIPILIMVDKAEYFKRKNE